MEDYYMRGCAILALPSDDEVVELGQGALEVRARHLLERLRNLAFSHTSIFYIFTEPSLVGERVATIFHFSGPLVSDPIASRMTMESERLHIPTDGSRETVRACLANFENFQKRRGLGDHSVIVILAQANVAQALAEANFAERGGDRHITTAFPPINCRPMVWGDARVVRHGGTSIDLVSVVPTSEPRGPVTPDDVAVMMRL